MDGRWKNANFHKTIVFFRWNLEDSALMAWYLSVFGRISGNICVDLSSPSVLKWTLTLLTEMLPYIYADITRPGHVTLLRILPTHSTRPLWRRIFISHAYRILPISGITIGSFLHCTSCLHHTRLYCTTLSRFYNTQRDTTDIHWYAKWSVWFWSCDKRTTCAVTAVLVRIEREFEWYESE